MTIKVLEKTEGCFPKEFEQGDWYDLSTAEEVRLKAPQANKLHKLNQGKPTPEIRVRDVDFDFQLISLGVAIKLPKGMEAHIVPRSSSFKKYGILQANSKGIVDYTYQGNNDEWKLPVVATRAVTIPKGTRIAQFRILLSQKATVWQKLRWLLSSKPKLVKTNTLSDNARGGFGSTDSQY